MKNFSLCMSVACGLLLALSLTNAGFAQTRTAWEMHDGEGIVSFGYQTPYHGYEMEYDFATIPAESDPNWGPAPDPDIIGYSKVPSSLCGVMACRYGADFTYFQTFVNVPSNVLVTDFTISFSGIDDGVRVTIFNSDYPVGVVVPGSYVFLGGTGTANLATLVKPGEVNRVVVTQTDDCCYHSYLSSAVVVLNGELVPVPIDVGIDIKPGSYPNCFNLNGHGVIPVAILGSAVLDVTDIDVTSVQFAGLNVRVKGNGYVQCSIEDVSGDFASPEGAPDGLDDLVCQFVDDAGSWSADNGTASVIGELLDGTVFLGTDEICMVPTDN
jgi:hypothetical protein